MSSTKAIVGLALLFGAGCVTEEGESTDELARHHDHDSDSDSDSDRDHDSDSDSDSDSDDGRRYRVESWSSQGNPIPTTGEFFQAQGTNGRSCGTCHSPGDGWAFNVDTANKVFDRTGGLDPLFSRLDADIPTLTDAAIDAMTEEERRGVFTQLLQARFTRSITPPAARDFDLIAATDPFGVSSVATQRMWFFRRSMPTANFKSHTVSWDSANTQGLILRDGLIRQARGNVTGAQEGPPATDAVIFEIVDFEMAISSAATKAPGVGKLDKHGAKGGPKNHQNQPLVAGRFDLYDAYKHSHNPHKRAIYRGQELFNKGDKNGKNCGGCHNAANSGQNVNGGLFNVGASNPEFATSDMAVFTFKNRTTAAELVLTDPGRGGRNGVFADLGKFKTPTLRGLVARDAYFHNGVAGSLEEVIDIYEAALGFDFTWREERDLVAFLSAL